MPRIDIFGEFEDENDEINDIQNLIFSDKKQYNTTKRGTNARLAQYEVKGDFTITDEIVALRKKYRDDYVQAHLDIFPASTGIKEYGEDQKTAIRRFQKIAQTRGKLVQVEPRGFAKTSRAVNQMLLAILEGDIKFGLIVSSELSKSIDIMEQLKTELLTNDKLAELYPGTIACFVHMEGKASKAKSQTLNGESTQITWTNEEIRFPTVPGEPSSGAVIMVRTKDNLRGISKKVPAGPDKGKVWRPDFVLLDDLQTDKDARSPTVCQNIVKTVKRSVMFGGSHSKKIRAIVTITPQQKGDVASHFILREPSWEVALYSMVKQMPKNMDKWDEFGRILLNFNKRIEGDRERAQRRARQFVLDNYDELHEGAVLSWDWCYEWDVDDPIEVSALHHAMVFYYEEGEDAFNYECQCKVDEETEEEEKLVADIDTIISKVSNTPRRVVPADAMFICTHIDLNTEVFTYVTLASSQQMIPRVIDYGTFPEQPTNHWKKGDLHHKLAQLFPDIPENDESSLIYAGVQRLTSIIAKRFYKREDGVELQNRYIGVDAKWLTDDVIRAIREADNRSMLIPMQGKYYGHRERPMMEEAGVSGRDQHYHCYTAPSTDHSVLMVRVDVNWIKTFIHRGFNARSGTIGSYTLYQPTDVNEHYLFANHCNGEFPTLHTNLKEERVIVEWTQYRGKDNEYFDNIVGATALLFKCGCTLKLKKEIKYKDINEFF